MCDDGERTVESALRQIGFLESNSSSGDSRTVVECLEDPSGNGKQVKSVDQDKLLQIVQEVLDQVQQSTNDTRTAAMVKWQRLLVGLPYHIALDILEYIEQKVYDNHREVVGYFGRDPTRKLHLIFRALDIIWIPSPQSQLDEDDDNEEEQDQDDRALFMGFIMRNVRHVTIGSVQNMPQLDVWLQPPMKTSIESIRIHYIDAIDRLKRHPFSPTMFSACKSLLMEEINDYSLQFKNLTRLTFSYRFRGQDMNAIEQLPAHSLISLTMPIYTQEHIQSLSDALGHLRRLRNLTLEQHNTGDMWSSVAVALRNAPPTLRRLTYFQRTWNYDDNMRVKFSSGMFSAENSTFAESIEALCLNCHVGDLTGLAEFSRLKTLSMLDIEDAIEVHNLHLALCHVPSLIRLNLRFNWKNHDNSFTPVVSALERLVDGSPGLQDLSVTMYTFSPIVSDSVLAQFLAYIAHSTKVKLQWSMYIDTGTVSFSPDMYRSFLIVLLNPRLRNLLHNFYQEDSLYDNYYWLREAVHTIHEAIEETNIWK